MCGLGNSSEPTTKQVYDVTQELKCCRLCGAFNTCNHKGECCPECQYFDEEDYLCLAPETLKKKRKRRTRVVAANAEADDVDPGVFFFEDDEEEEEEEELAPEEIDDEDLTISDLDWD